MRKTVHLCLSSHDEVMFRSEEDLNMGFNCLALAILDTESRLLAEGFMTTHYHCLLQTDYFREVMYKCRFAYARYFNNKYGRKGRLGERQYFSLDVEGLHHTMAAMDYVLRQGVHHGLATTPFEYRHCSANSFFRSALGKPDNHRLIQPSRRHIYLPSNVSIPVQYRMDEHGLLLREDIVDTGYVEQLYISPRSFLFHMSKITDEKDIQKQKDENDLPPVTLDNIEAGVPAFSPKVAKDAEYGKVNRSVMTDLELCRFIDRVILPRYVKDSQRMSIYSIPEEKRVAIANLLWEEYSRTRYRSNGGGVFAGRIVTEAQIRRCTATK